MLAEMSSEYTSKCSASADRNVQYYSTGIPVRPLRPCDCQRVCYTIRDCVILTDLHTDCESQHSVSHKRAALKAVNSVPSIAFGQYY